MLTIADSFSNIDFMPSCPSAWLSAKSVESGCGRGSRVSLVLVGEASQEESTHLAALRVASVTGHV